MRNRSDGSGFTTREAFFFRRWLSDPLRTGAIYPSSRHLAGAMAREVPALPSADEVVVELGPGTGAMTRAMLDRGIPEDRLVLVEFSPEFCAALRAAFPRASIVEGDAYEPGAAFAAALNGRRTCATLSSLPLMARPEAERESAVRHHLASMAPGAPFIQFTYSPTLPVRPERVGAELRRAPWVLRNLPPARVLVYRRTATPEAAVT